MRYLLAAAMLVGLGILRILVFLPRSWQLGLGRLAGRIARPLASKRAAIARTNLALCFPDASPDETGELLSEHFQELGIGLFETAQAWWWPQRRLEGLTRVTGREHLDQALSSNTAVVLVGGHMTSMELASRLLGEFLEFDITYRPLGIPGVDGIMARGRARGAARLISKFAPRELLRDLKDGRTLWFAPDQAPLEDQAVTARFFANPAATNASLSRLAESVPMTLLPFAYHRAADGVYELNFHAPLAGFPSEDAVADAERINSHLENAVREAPAQYYWVHRRFKGHTDYPV